MQELSRRLTEPFSAYNRAVVPEVDHELAEVGPGTPGGEYLRRFWHPVAHADQLGDLPVAVRILGEDLVVFRDKSGAVGLLERHCGHRGTSLEYGKIEDHGIRCCYHGWLFDVDGKVLEAPAEPESNPYEGKLYQGAYPVYEYNGLLFSYMGPPALRPPFPMFDIYDQPGMALGHGEADLRGNIKPCNWLQVMDNVVDQVHEPFLHARHSGIQFLDDNGREVTELLELGEPDWFETPIGILCHESRRVADSVWVRSMEYICPNIALVALSPTLPPRYPEGKDELSFLPLLIRWRVPVDDAHTTEFAFIFYRKDGENQYVTNPIPGTRSNYGDRPYEERQRFPGDYDAQVSQRQIAVHACEHLASTDKGVAMMRRMVRQGIEAAADGGDPRGVVRGEAASDVPTHANEIVRRVPHAGSDDAERELLKQVSRDVCERSLKGSPTVAKRKRAIAAE